MVSCREVFCSFNKVDFSKVDSTDFCRATDLLTSAIFGHPVIKADAVG